MTKSLTIQNEAFFYLLSFPANKKVQFNDFKPESAFLFC